MTESYERALEIAAMLARAGSFDASLDLLLSAQTAEPDRPEAFERAGLVLERAGRIDEAIGSLRRAVEVDPERASAWTNLAFVTGQHYPARGIRVYQELLGRWPEDLAGWHNLGCLLRDAGAYDDALQALTMAVGLDDQRPEVWLSMGLLHRARGSIAEARWALQAALDLRPDFEPARAALAALEVQP